MFPAIWKRLDQRIIRASSGSVRPADGVDPRIGKAMERLVDPACFAPKVSVPKLQFDNERDFHFETPLPSPWEPNNRVWGTFYRAGPDWRERPTLLLVHGWNGELLLDYHFPFMGRWMTRRGLNVVTMVLPYHGRRRPRDPGAETNFISPDLFSMVEAVRQSLAEMVAMLLWLEQEGVPRAGMWGVSLGGWLTGLLAAHHQRLHAAVLLTPVVRMDLAVQHLEFFDPVRENLRGTPADLHPLNLDTKRPQLPTDRLLLVAARHDQFVPLDTIRTLQRSWGEPELWTRSHGHISILLSIRTLRNSLRWLEGRLQG